MVTVTGFDYTNWTHGDGDYLARYFPMRSFWSDGGDFIQLGLIDEKENYFECSAEAAGGVLTIDDCDLPTPAENEPLGRWALKIYPFNGKKLLETIWENFSLPTAYGSSVTYPEIVQSNRTPIIRPGSPQLELLRQEVSNTVQDIPAFLEIPDEDGDSVFVPLQSGVTGNLPISQSRVTGLINALAAKQPKNPIDVSLLATGGSGTYDDPWTGWAAGMVLGHNKSWFFPFGVYLMPATPPNWGHFTNQSFVGEMSILKGSGSGTGSKVVNLVADQIGMQYVDYNSFGLRMENFIIDGAETCEKGIYALGQEYNTLINVRIRNVSKIGLHLIGGVASVFINLDISTAIGDSDGIGYAPVAPEYGIYNDTVEEHAFYLQAAQFINCKIGNCTLDGVRAKKMNQCVWLGGAIEGSAGRGLALDADCQGNTFIGTDFEGNGSLYSNLDIDIYGRSNKFINCLVTGTTRVSDGAYRTTFESGAFGSFTVFGGAFMTIFDHIGYNLNNIGGTIPAASAEIIYRASPFNHGTGTFNRAIHTGEILYSPNGTAYRIKVANDGTLSTEAA